MTSLARSFSHWRALGLALTATGSVLLPSLSHAAATCAEVRAQDPLAGDGTYPLAIEGQEVAVYCHDMAGTPREYLTLQRTGGAFNYSSYGEGQNTSPTGLTTWFTKARFNPATLSVVTNDTTFTTSQGWIYFGEYIYFLPLASASDCSTDYSHGGRSNVDLTGTPFDIVDQFRVGGFAAAGSVNYSGSQIIHLTGGGYCGGIGTQDNSLQLSLRSTPEPPPEPEPELVHRYSFTTGGADLVSGADASLEGGATIANGEVVLNGTSAYVSLPIGGTIATLQDATFEAWVKWDSAAGQSWARVFDFNDGEESSIYLAASGASAAGFVISPKEESEPQVAVSSGQLPTGALTHVVVTIDHAASRARFFVNAVEVARMTTTHTPSILGSPPNIWLGRSPGETDPLFKGSISEFRVYRTVLSPRLIAAHYAAGDKPRELKTSFNARPANPTNQDTAPFIFSAQGTALRYLCSLDEGPFQSCTSPFTTQPLDEGPHTFRVQARDTEGNEEASPSEYSWRVDKTFPDTSFGSTPELETGLQSPSFSFSSTEPPSTFECSLDGAPFTACPGVFPPLDDGEHELAVQARDAAGNVDLDAARYRWRVDTVAPVPPSLQEPAPSQELFTATPGFSGTAEPGTTVTLFVDGVEAGSVQADAQGFWRSELGSPLAWGEHRASAMATDRVGNVGPLLPEVPFSTSRRGAYGLGCSANPSSWLASGPWALLLLGLLRSRSRPLH